jgi:hypothetical protein
MAPLKKRRTMTKLEEELMKADADTLRDALVMIKDLLSYNDAACEMILFATYLLETSASCGALRTAIEEIGVRAFYYARLIEPGKYRDIPCEIDTFVCFFEAANECWCGRDCQDVETWETVD